jgi:hypothetical protein
MNISLMNIWECNRIKEELSAIILLWAFAVQLGNHFSVVYGCTWVSTFLVPGILACNAIRRNLKIRMVNLHDKWKTGVAD